MNAASMLQPNTAHEFQSKGCKRVNGFSTAAAHESKKLKADDETGYEHNDSTQDDPFAISKFLCSLDCGKYGSVTNDIEALRALKMQVLRPLFDPLLAPLYFRTESSPCPDQTQSLLGHGTSPSLLINANPDGSNSRSDPSPIVILDSDDEEPNSPTEPESIETKDPDVLLKQPLLKMESDDPDIPMKQIPLSELLEKESEQPEKHIERESGDLNILIQQPPSVELSNGELTDQDIRPQGVGNDCVVADEEEVEEKKDDAAAALEEEEYRHYHDNHTTDDDGFGDIWKEMMVGVDKSCTVEYFYGERKRGDRGDCEHSFVLKDDTGYVCRVCGVIDRGIETIIEFQSATMKSSRTGGYLESCNARMAGSRSSRQPDAVAGPGLTMSDDISIHPRHMKHMRTHQMDGFRFLVRNLMSGDPSGCVLAHAPGSGKTFMIISFVQSFLARNPSARLLIILPKGILGTWKREFRKWQIEETQLIDFYSRKAENRPHQLEVLREWAAQRSIMFVGYKQFASIVTRGDDASSASVACEDILLNVPAILILDEGHTPRNEDTDVLRSIARVRTPRKVVLSGTLYQNHVREVFNVLNLVRPRFLKSETSRAIVRRVMSVRHAVTAPAFYDAVERTLRDDVDFRRRVSVIKELREMTRDVLHYYRGDFLDDLPGLVDFTAVLRLSPRQRRFVPKILSLERKFKVSSAGSAVYLHPDLIRFVDDAASAAAIDGVAARADITDGVKAKFFMSLLEFCESAHEKLLVFGQYLLPLKFLERVVTLRKGWTVGKEVFVISGESSPEDREWSMERFNSSDDARVFFGSIKACGEGISLVGASRLLFLDVHMNPSVTRQAVGRAFRPGQEKVVYIYRLVAADTHEVDDHHTCFKKESISKMWFEWNECSTFSDFQMETVLDAAASADLFLQSSSLLTQDIEILYRR